MPPDRRDFLKTLAVAGFLPDLAGAETASIPTCESLASVTMPHRFGDLFNPPGLTNFLGCAQAALDVTAVRSVSFPPFAQGESRDDGRSELTGVLFVDGEYFTALREPISFVWRPDRIERSAVWRGLRLSSVMIVPPERNAVAVRLRVDNLHSERRTVEIRLLIQGGVTKKVEPWGWLNPGESANRATVVADRSAVVFEAQHSQAAAAVAAWPGPSAMDGSALTYRLELGPGASRDIVFSNAIGETAAEVLPVAQDLARNFDEQARRSHDEWNATLAAAFTPGNGRFSGYLPTLVTSDASIARLYHTALMTLLFHRRTTPASVYGTAYVTLAPRYWETTTFLWDISLSSTMLALLDPAVLRRMVETWMTLDIHKHFGTEFLKGEGVGPWYSVNDFAMCRMVREYLRWTGDHAWLDKRVGEATVIERLVDYATHWRALDVNQHGLADYGGVNNLLEAVSSYVHEVAGLNAANVFCLRFVAELLDHRGDMARASALGTEASTLARHVLDLYVPGAGFWNCRLPDGRMQPVRHCYDFGTVLSSIPDDLSTAQKREMVAFFHRELQTSAWMRALSARDGDVIFSVRPDHQWTGAYAAWPAIALSALYNAGEDRLAQEWMHGLREDGHAGAHSAGAFCGDGRRS